MAVFALAAAACDQLGMGDGEDLIRLPESVYGGVDLDENGEFTFQFDSDTLWSADIDGGDADWLEAIPSSGHKGKNISITLKAKKPNLSNATRDGNVHIGVPGGKGEDHHIIVRQAPTPKPDVVVTSFTISPAGPIKMKKGENKVLEAIYTPADAPDPYFRWEKPNGTDAFDVQYPWPQNQSGSTAKANIIAIGAGKATITVTEQRGGAKATVEIIVEQ